TRHLFVRFFLPVVVAFYQLFSFSRYLVFAVFFQLVHVGFGIFHYFFLQQRVHTRIGLNKSTIDTLTLATNHPFVYTQRKYFLKQTQKYLFTKKLSCTADGTVPRQFFV